MQQKCILQNVFYEPLQIQVRKINKVPLEILKPPGSPTDENFGCQILSSFWRLIKKFDAKKQTDITHSLQSLRALAKTDKVKRPKREWSNEYQI